MRGDLPPLTGLGDGPFFAISARCVSSISIASDALTSFAPPALGRAHQISRAPPLAKALPHTSVLADVMEDYTAEGERDLTRDIRLELSSSNRSSCQVCKEKIDKDSIRVAHPSRSSNISIMKCERLMPLSRHVGFLYVPRLRAFFVYSPAQTCTLPAT